MRSYEAYLRLVEDALPHALDALEPIPPQLREAMEYSLLSGGKRLRPVLLLAATEAVGGDAESALSFACALEMIHTYSLIHDDLPAMDDDVLRRGRPTSHVRFGEAMAILAGDGLLSAAMELMLRASLGTGDLRGTRAAHAIARRCGVSGMVAGQVIDMNSEGLASDEATVRTLHLRKTADLLTAAVEAGMILGGADDETLARGVAYGQHLGLAFQIADDLLDVTGTAAELGKSVGKDRDEAKATWVAVKGMEGAREDAQREAALAGEAIQILGENAAFFIRCAEDAVRRNH